MNEIDIIEYKNMLKGIIDLAVPHAEAIRAYYNALIKSGFTPEEALRLTERHGYQPPFNSGRSDDY